MRTEKTGYPKTKTSAPNVGGLVEQLKDANGPTGGRGPKNPSSKPAGANNNLSRYPLPKMTTTNRKK